MIYVVKLLIDDGRTVFRFFDTPQDAHSFFDKAAGPLTDGVAIRGGQGAFIEAARMFLADTSDRACAKKQVLAEAAELLRDSDQEKDALLKELIESLDL